VRLETKLRATLTEQQKALFEQIKKTDAEITTGMKSEEIKFLAHCHV
jgi:DNA-binding MarR family transcriptional regulator